MHAESVLAVRCEDGVTSAARVRGDVPLVIRTIQDRDGGLTAYLVGGAAGPLGGDDLALTVDVGPGALLRVRSAAASMALPGPRGHGSRLRVEATVGEGGALDWWPEPLISVAASDHEALHAISLSSTARLRWIDEVVLGRHEERGGRLRCRQRLEVGGTVVLDHELAAGAPHLDGPGANGPFRAIASVLVRDGEAAGEPAAPVVGPSLRCAAFPLAEGAVLTMALADDLRTAAAAVESSALPWRCPVQFP